MPTPKSPDRRRRQHSRPLTRRKIAAAAIDIVRDEGAEALSMRKVAAVFGVDVAALYRHVRNKDELLAETGRLASEQVELEVAEAGSFDQRFLGLCRSIRDRIAEHPELGIHSGGSPWATPFLARANGLIAKLLLEVGLTGEALVHATQSVLHLVTGIAQSEVLAHATSLEENRAFARTIHESLSEAVQATWPATRAAQDWTVDFDGFFDFAVRALLDGLVPSDRR